MGTAGNPSNPMLAMLGGIIPTELLTKIGEQLGGDADLDHAERLKQSSADLARIADAVEEIRDAVRTVATLAPLVEQLKDHPFVIGMLAGKSAMSVARKKG